MSLRGHFWTAGAELFKLDGHFLFASMFWGAIGTGFLVYGKRQTSIAAFVAGLGLIGISYFARTAWEMHLMAAIILVIAFLLKNRDS
jgi:hypothetical protein